MVKLTHTQLMAVLAESSTMRSVVSTLVLQTTTGDIREKIENIVREFTGNKIGAIKAIRERLKAAEIYPAFTLEWNFAGNDSLGLADCKRLVEHVASYLGVSLITTY